MGRAAEGWRVVPGRRPDDPLYVRFRHAGKRYYLTTGTRDPGDAAQRAATIYAEIVSGRRRQGSTLNARLPLDEVAASYLEHIEATGSGERYSMQHQHFRVHIIPFFRGLAEVGSEASWADFEAHRRRKGVGARTIAKELSTLRSFAKWCRLRSLLEAVPDYRAPRARSDFKALCLEPEQVEAILAALPVNVVHGRAAGQPIRARFTFAWQTMLRPATVARILVEDYDRGRKRLRIRDSADKARFGRELPLSERAWKALEAVCPKSGPIFGRAKMRETLKTAARAAGLPEALARRVTPYTFRHSRITQLASVTSDLRGLAYLAGHKDLTTTSHYVHGDVKAGERVLLAVASGDNGRQPPETDPEGPKTGRSWPSDVEENQRFGRVESDSGSCTRKGVEVRFLSFAPAVAASMAGRFAVWLGFGTHRASNQSSTCLSSPTWAGNPT